jgi:D-3-phosphoglycerate dehydrogenase
MKKKVLLAAEVHNYLLQKLLASGYGIVHAEDLTGTEVAGAIADCEGIITSNKLEISKALIDKAPGLKWIGRMGSGMEIIDVAYAESKGIKCYSSPEGNANAVAEQALGMLLSLQHRILKAHLEIKEHLWLREENRGIEIEGMTAGIIGLGNNGAAFARKLLAMDVTVLGYDKYKSDPGIPGVTACQDMGPIWEQADMISFHVPLNGETRHYFNDDFLNRMRKPFVLLNLSRGPVVSLKSLYKGMDNGRVTAAALDVWEKEPYWEMPEAEKEMADKLMRHPHFIGTPHIGGYSRQALYKMSYFLALKIGL